MDIHFATEIAKKDERCGRCDSLGISTPTIIMGDEYIRIWVNERPSNYQMCNDCFLRLHKEAIDES